MVVFFDIDGTIIDNDTQRIPQSTMDAVTALRKNGHIPVLNTGRVSGHIDPRVEAMDFMGKVCGCGMEVILEDTVLLRETLPAEVFADCHRMVKECNMQVLYERPGQMIIDGKNSSGPASVSELERCRWCGVPEIIEYDELSDPWFMKMVSYDTAECQKQRFVEHLSQYFDCIIRGPHFIEYVKKGHSKATGMDFLLHHLGLTRQDAVAIGDSTNDLTMFAAAGTTIAMGGCSEKLKPYATYLTDTVLNDGIAKALKHLGLI